MCGRYRLTAKERYIRDHFGLDALDEIAIFRGHLDLETVLPEIQRFANDPALGPFVEDFFVGIKASKLLQ
jgi:hypothetical protein